MTERVTQTEQELSNKCHSLHVLCVRLPQALFMSYKSRGLFAATRLKKIAQKS